MHSNKKKSKDKTPGSVITKENEKHEKKTKKQQKETIIAKKAVNSFVITRPSAIDISVKNTKVNIKSLPFFSIQAKLPKTSPGATYIPLTPGSSDKDNKSKAFFKNNRATRSVPNSPSPGIVPSGSEYTDDDSDSYSEPLISPSPSTSTSPKQDTSESAANTSSVNLTKKNR